MVQSTVSKREVRKQATARALRLAALRLITEHGYDATSTADIAERAGVTQRTFFNHFPTKEAVVVMPAEFLSSIVTDALRSRPLGEDLPKSLAAATMHTARALATLAEADDSGQRELVLTTVRLIFNEPSVQKVFLERRAIVEDLVWEIVLERGGSPDDLSARSAVATIVALNYLGLRIWADGEGRESLPAVYARCLLSAPDPARFASGITEAR